MKQTIHAPPGIALIAHPAATDLPLRVYADAHRLGGGLRCRYRIEGDLDRVVLDYAAGSLPADRLWQHSCCEAFVPGAGTGYREFNVAANGQWTCFDFLDTRTPDGKPQVTRATGESPVMRFNRDAEGLSLNLEIPAALLPVAANLRSIGLSVVVEVRGGGHGYYAPRHAGPAPDFHDRRTWTVVPEAEGLR